MPTYDIALFQTENGAPIAGIATKFTTGRLITSLEKLSQRFILEFLTILGSVPFQPKRGCNFITTVTTRTLSSELDVFNAFNASMIAVTSNLQSEESSSDPDSERFLRADLTSVSISPGSLRLTIVVRNRSGDLGTVNIPVNFSSVTANPVPSLD